MRPKSTLKSLRSMFLITLSLVICAFGWQNFQFRTAKAEKQSVKIERAATLAAKGRGGENINFKDGEIVPTEYAAGFDLSQAEPLALATGDFDRDGVDDLISGYASENSGLLVIHRGSADSIFPNGRADEILPFLPEAKIFNASEPPDFLVAGDFDNDGRQDIVTAARNADALQFFKGDGQGNLRVAGRILLAGKITALAAGELNRKDGLKDLAVGITGADGAKVVIFEGAPGELKLSETFDLPSAATDLAVVSFGEPGFGDLAVAAGNEIIFVHGRDRQLTLNKEERRETEAVVSRQSFESKIIALAAGSFTGGLGGEIVLLNESGSMFRVAPKGAKDITTEAVTLNTNVTAKAVTLGKMRVSASSATDDLILFDRENRKIHIFGKGENLELRATFDSRDEIIAALPMRLNKDGLEDIVFLSKNQIAPSVAMTAPQAVFTVNSNLNNPDATPGNGVCEISPPGSGICTLRAAIQEANATVAADEIRFNIPGSSPTIAPTSTSILPQVTRTVTIDATTQPGFDGSPIVELNGTSSNSHGFNVFQAHNSIFRGFIINRFADSGILLFDTNDAKIEGNYIGTDRTGTTAQGNGGTGSLLDSAVVLTGGNSVVGGRTTAARNVISGNTFHGIHIFGGRVEGNFIGTDKNGMAALGNCAATNVDPETCTNVLAGNQSGGNNPLNVAIGAAAANAGNVISGNNGQGLYIGGSNDGSAVITVENNFIGTNANTTADLGNSRNGIMVERLETSNLRIGGIAVESGNVISGNDRHGILMTEVDGGNGIFTSSVEGNFIGVGVGIGSGLILNNRHAIALTGLTSDIRIGGFLTNPDSCAGHCNVIAFASGFQAVHINQFNPNPIAPNAVPNRVSNSILGNDFIFPTSSLLLVDLVGNTGRTFNDPMDEDQGVNFLQNFADITQVTPSAGSLNVQGNLHSTPGLQFDIEFFLAEPEPEGMYAELVHRVRVTTDANGNAPFNRTITEQTQTGDKIFTITTSVNDNSSSEASPLVLTRQQDCSYSVAPPVITIDHTGGPVDVNVLTGAGCLWTAASNSSFITFQGYDSDSGVIGVGSGSARFQVGFNIGPARTGTVTVAGQTVTINQADLQGCSFHVTPTGFVVPAAGQDVTVNISAPAGCAWTAQSIAPFITGGGNGSGNGSVTFTVTPNNTPNARNGTMIVAGQTITVNQAAGQPCTFNVDPTAFNVPAAGQNITVNVTTQAGCDWTAAGAGFVTGGGNFTGPGSVTFNVAANNGPGRQAVLTVAGQLVAVDQANGCAFTVNPLSANVPALGGNVTVNITTLNGCQWSAASNSGFITGGGNGTGSGSASFTVDANTGPSRAGTVTVAGQTVTINQGNGCAFGVNPLIFNLSAAGRDIDIAIPTQGGCAWTANSNAAFITGGGSGIGGGSTTFTVAANNGLARTGTMTVAGQTVTVTQLSKNNNLDFDGDNKADIAKVGTGNNFTDRSLQPSAIVNWVINNSSNGSQRVAAFGEDADKIVPGDYNGDGLADLAVWRPSSGTWFIARPTGVPAQSFDAIPFGLPTDKPVPADYDGDGKTDIAVFRPSDGDWWILQSTDNQIRTIHWGLSSDKLVPGDYDGDGRADIAVFRPSDRVWYILQSGDNSFRFIQLGLSDDKPVPGDYDGDFKTDIAVFRPSDGDWHILRSSDNSLLGLNWGLATDVPVPADYDGDLKTDVAVWRPSSGTWFILQSSDGIPQIQQLGQNGDVPVPSALLPD